MHEAVIHAVIAENADDIRAETQIQRVAETDHAAVAENQIQRDGRDGEHHDAAKQGEIERLLGKRRVKGHQRQHG